MLGVVNTIFEHMLADFSNETLAWAKSCNVERSVTHAGSGFNGNACKKLLEKLDVLRASCSIGCLKFVKALDDFHLVVKSCFGQNLKPNFEKHIIDFKNSFLGLGVSVRPKIHAVFYHVAEFCNRHEKALGFYSEQAMEAPRLLSPSIKSGSRVQCTTCSIIKSIKYDEKCIPSTSGTLLVSYLGKYESYKKTVFKNFVGLS